MFQIYFAVNILYLFSARVASLLKPKTFFNIENYYLAGHTFSVVNKLSYAAPSLPNHMLSLIPSDHTFYIIFFDRSDFGWNMTSCALKLENSGMTELIYG